MGKNVLANQYKLQHWPRMSKVVYSKYKYKRKIDCVVFIKLLFKGYLREAFYAKLRLSAKQVRHELKHKCRHN